MTSIAMIDDPHSTHRRRDRRRVRRGAGRDLAMLLSMTRGTAPCRGCRGPMLKQTNPATW